MHKMSLAARNIEAFTERKLESYSHFAMFILYYFVKQYNALASLWMKENNST